MVSGWRAHTLGLPQALTWKAVPSLGQYMSIYILLPVVYAISLWKCARAGRRPAFVNWDGVALLTLAGVALALEVAQSLNWLRVYCVSMPGIILLVWFLGTQNKFQLYATRLLWVGVLCLACLQTWSRHHQQNALAQLPAGTVGTTPLNAEKLLWLRDHTMPGESFFQAGWPGVYLPLDLHNPVFLDVLETGDQTRPEYVALTIQQLQSKRVQYILWSPRLDSTDIYQGPATYHLAPFRAFLGDHYQRVWTFPDQDEIWERR